MLEEGLGKLTDKKSLMKKIMALISSDDEEGIGINHHSAQPETDKK